MGQQEILNILGNTWITRKQIQEQVGTAMSPTCTALRKLQRDNCIIKKIKPQHNPAGGIQAYYKLKKDDG